MDPPDGTPEVASGAEPPTTSIDTAPDAGRAPARAADDARGRGGVALLLAVAAALAAILAGRSAMLSDAAGDAWQSALRADQKRATAVILDIRQVYGIEGDGGLLLLAEDLVAEELTKAAAADPDLAAVLLAEARVHADAAANLIPNVELDRDYRLSDGTPDVERRLAEYRAQYPELLELDPDASVEAGDRDHAHATGTISAALPLGIAFLAGALAMPFADRRRWLLIVGWVAVVMAAAAAILVEVGA
jgi:hypothetical protein